jgi:cyclophilin family peptidyl-prolyl cis-trans isomerase
MPQNRTAGGLKSLFPLGKLLGFRRAAAQRAGNRRLELEELEDRSLLSTSATGTISGTLFVDSIGTRTFIPGAPTLPGIAVTLSGTTNQGTAVNLTATTDANGAYSFNGVLPGHYQVSTAPVAGVLGSETSTTFKGAVAGSASTSSLSVSAGGSSTQNLGFLGLAPQSVSLRQFLSSTSSADFPDLSALAGSGIAFGNTPFVTNPISDVTVAMNSANTLIDLARNFSAPDISTSEVTMNTSKGPLNVTLFDAQAPQTVANFYDYVNSGAYNSSIFHRLVSGFVLQGGGATVQKTSSGTTMTSITTLPPISNEFSVSNTPGTLAMAQSAGNPNSATDQFFFNLVNNSRSLDPQQFTVFGKVADASSQAVLNSLASTPTKNESGTPAAAANPTVDLQNVPLINYSGTHFPTDASPSNFLTISSVTVVNRPDFLTYSVVANSNPGLVTASITNENLTLSYAPNMTGTAVITVQATNSIGASVDASFNVNVIL